MFAGSEDINGIDESTLDVSGIIDWHMRRLDQSKPGAVSDEHVMDEHVMDEHVMDGDGRRLPPGPKEPR
jgi:hypothetical protein